MYSTDLRTKVLEMARNHANQIGQWPDTVTMSAEQYREIVERYGDHSPVNQFESAEVQVARGVTFCGLHVQLSDILAVSKANT